MFSNFRSPAVAAFAVWASLTVGSVSAQELSIPGPVSTQLQAKAATTFFVQFDTTVDPSEYRRNAASIATRFNARVVHTYENVFPGFAIRVNEGGGARLLAAAGQFGIASVKRDFIVSIDANDFKGPSANANCRKTKDCPTEPDPIIVDDPSPPDPDPEHLGWNIKRVLHVNEDEPAEDFSGSGIRVCVLDTGIYNHPDLNLNTGKNFTSDDPTATNDGHGHGTHVAGTTGAKAGNGTEIDNVVAGPGSMGVVGVAPGVPVVPVKVLDDRGSGVASEVIAGIDWAVDTSAGGGYCTIANMSLGGLASDTDTALDDAVLCGTGVTPRSYALGACDGNKTLFSIAAGNSTADIDPSSGTSGYSPARASMGSNDNIFTIASSSDNDVWTSFSNYHYTDYYTESGTLNQPDPESRVDFALPGKDIVSTWNDGGTKSISGTSMAAPHMAGLLVRFLCKTGTCRLLGDSEKVNNSAFVRTNGSDVQRLAFKAVMGKGPPRWEPDGYREYYNIPDLPLP